jgi:hypothetical protein
MNGFRQFRLVKNEINWLGDLDPAPDFVGPPKACGPQHFSSAAAITCQPLWTMSVDHARGANIHSAATASVVAAVRVGVLVVAGFVAVLSGFLGRPRPRPRASRA